MSLEYNISYYFLQGQRLVILAMEAVLPILFCFAKTQSEEHDCNTALVAGPSCALTPLPP